MYEYLSLQSAVHIELMPYLSSEIHDQREKGEGKCKERTDRVASICYKDRNDPALLHDCAKGVRNDGGKQYRRFVLREIHIHLEFVVRSWSSCKCEAKLYSLTYRCRYYAVVPRICPVAQIERYTSLDIIHHAAEETYLPPFRLSTFLCGLSRGLA